MIIKSRNHGISIGFLYHMSYFIVIRYEIKWIYEWISNDIQYNDLKYVLKLRYILM